MPADYLIMNGGKMLYPRVTELNGIESLVDDTQMCGYKEHMTHEHRVLFLEGLLARASRGYRLRSGR